MVPGFHISTNIRDMDVDAVYSFISNSYWSENIPRETFTRAVENSLCFAILDKQNVQIGFARAVTDRATFAYLADIYVLEAYRGRGLSKWLMKTIMAHPDLQELRRISLATRDAHGLYEQYGFTPLSQPEMLMEVWNPEIYQQQ